MADREWQRAVLRDIGESGIGLVTLNSTTSPAPTNTFEPVPTASATPPITAVRNEPPQTATLDHSASDPNPTADAEAPEAPEAPEAEPIPVTLPPALSGPPDLVPAAPPVLGAAPKPVTPKPAAAITTYSRSPAIPPKPVPTDALVRRNAHGDPLVRRLGHGLRKAVGGGAAAEVREHAELRAMLTRAVSTCRQIAVTSVRGGAGKTTIAALAASAIGEIRDDRVLAVDADPHLGSLPLRLGVRADYTVHDLATAHSRGWEETSRFLARARGNVWVLPASYEGRILADLDLDTFRTAFGGLSRFFSTAMIDCGAGVLGALQRGILETSHAQLLITPATVDGALGTRGVLDWFAANGKAHLLQRTVVVVVTHTPHADADLDRLRELLGGGLPVIHMPYDRHIATGAAIDASRLAATTRIAATRIAAEAFARSTGV